MNRIDLIKDRLETEYYVFTEENIEGTQNEYREAHEDVEYLLAKLEQAEKALGLIDGVYVPFSNRETIEVAETMKVMAREALKAIRS